VIDQLNTCRSRAKNAGLSGSVLGWVSVLFALLCGCTAINPMTASMPQQNQRERARELESMLDTAGFVPLTASSPEQKDRLRALPPMELGYYLDHQGAANYWLADPDYCGCLFHGDEASYERFQVLQKDNQTAENDRQALQAQRYQQPLGPWGPSGGFGPGAGFSFGPAIGVGGGFGFSL
jgi:hypothetical protein